MSALAKIIPYAAAVAVTFLALVLIKAFSISYPLDITVTNTTRSSELAVVGEGKVEAVPDTVFVDLGIQVSDAATAEEAQKKIDEVNNRIISALKSSGIEAKDIKTTNYNIYPQYSYTPEKENRISGYSGTASVTVKVSDVKLATRVINEGTKAGANRVQGTRFVVDKPQKYREEARNKAIENAKEQARKLASQLGITLGKVVNIIESASGNPPVPVYERMDLAAKSGGAPGPEMAPGTQTFFSTVTLYFEKK